MHQMLQWWLQHLSRTRHPVLPLQQEEAFWKGKTTTTTFTTTSFQILSPFMVFKTYLRLYNYETTPLKKLKTLWNVAFELLAIHLHLFWNQWEVEKYRVKNGPCHIIQYWAVKCICERLLYLNANLPSHGANVLTNWFMWCNYSGHIMKDILQLWHCYREGKVGFKFWS